MKCVYLNRDERIDRREAFEAQAERCGLVIARVSAPYFSGVLHGGFGSSAVRSCFLGHVMMADCVRDEPLLICEDDCVFADWPRALGFVSAMEAAGAECLYLHGCTAMRRAIGLLDSHAYVLVPRVAERWKRALAREYFRILERPASIGGAAYVDQVLSRVHQRDFRVFGCPGLAFQDRKRFGSDSGWMVAAP